MITPIGLALIKLWRAREHPDRPYVLINDSREYLTNVPASLEVDSESVPIHVCQNECALRRYTEVERDSNSRTPQILISRKQLEPDHLPDLQAASSLLKRTVTATDLARVLGVENPRPMLDRLPIAVFWGLSPFLEYLRDYSFERVLLASLLDDATVLSAAWSREQVLEKLWYSGCLDQLRRVLEAVTPEEKRALESEFLGLVQPWLTPAQRAVVEVAVLEQDPPPVLPLCLLASILDGWGSLEPVAMRRFLETSELGDLFVDVLQDGADLSGLAEWGRQVAFRADEKSTNAVDYLETKVFPRRPEALTEALSVVISNVSGNGEVRLVGQLVKLMEADGALLAHGLAVTLREMLGIAELSQLNTLPLESVTIKITERLDTADTAQCQRLVELLRRHQSREKYEDHVALLEAMITLHRLTGKACAAVGTLTGIGWQDWVKTVDQVYLPLGAHLGEAEILSNRLPGHFDISKVANRARTALSSISADYVDFYVDRKRGLPKWIQDKSFTAGTCRPWLNSDVVEMGVKPLLADVGIEQVYLIVFDGMSVTNWTMLRDRFLMAQGRELFRPYNGHGPEYRAFTYVPSLTSLCRRAIFAGESPYVFNQWALNATNEAELLDRCLHNLGCKPRGWNRNRHYLCYNEKDANLDLLRQDARTLIDTPAKLKAMVFNLQDRLLDKSGISSLQEVMITYVREVALPYLRRIAAQPKTAIVITSDHGFAHYRRKYVIGDLTEKGPGKDVHIHNRCLEYKRAGRTHDGPSSAIRIEDEQAYGMPPNWTAADVVVGDDSFGWPGGRETSAGNPHSVTGHDHGGLTPEETVVPVAIYMTRK